MYISYIYKLLYGLPTWLRLVFTSTGRIMIWVIRMEIQHVQIPNIGRSHQKTQSFPSLLRVNLICAEICTDIDADVSSSPLKVHQ